MDARRVIDPIAPPEIGPGFPKLLGASWLSNLGDGIALAAGPLLVASETSSPGLVAAATILQRLPWMLFGLAAGILADRIDRRRLVVAANGVRCVVLALLALTIVTGAVNIGVVLVAMFLLGTAEAFTDIALDSLMPTVVDREHLGVANARMVFGHRSLNQLAGPPVGAALFTVGVALPFVTQATLLALAVVLVAQMQVREIERGHAASIRSDLAAGVRWLWGHSPVRTLSIAIFTFNLTFGAAHALLVLYAIERLELGENGFGALLAASAVGGVLGAVLYDRLAARFSLGGMMRVGLTLETLTHLGLAITSHGIVAIVVMFVFGLQASVWGTTARAVRQAAVPDEFQGRVASVYMLAVHTGLVIGATLGGLVATLGGVVSVYWFAFAGSALALAAIWRQLPHIAHADRTG